MRVSKEGCVLFFIRSERDSPDFGGSCFPRLLPVFSIQPALADPVDKITFCAKHGTSEYIRRWNHLDEALLVCCRKTLLHCHFTRLAASHVRNTPTIHICLQTVSSLQTNARIHTHTPTPTISLRHMSTMCSWWKGMLVLEEGKVAPSKAGKTTSTPDKGPQSSQKHLTEHWALAAREVAAQRVLLPPGSARQV